MTRVLTRKNVVADKAIGLRLRGYRKARQITQDELGKRLGVTFQQIQKYENGRNRIAGSRMIEACEHLAITPAQLLGVENGKPAGRDPFDILGEPAVARLLEALRGMSRAQRTLAADIMQAVLKLANTK